MPPFMHVGYSAMQSAPFQVRPIVVDTVGRFMGLILTVARASRILRSPVVPADSALWLVRNEVTPTTVPDRFYTGRLTLHVEWPRFNTAPVPFDIEIEERYRADQGVQNRPAFTFMVHSVTVTRGGATVKLPAERIETALADILSGKPLDVATVDELRVFFG